MVSSLGSCNQNVYSHNNFRGARLGVNVGGAYAPDRSVCSDNVERTHSGAAYVAGNWGTGGAGTFTNTFTNSIVSPNQD